MGSRLHDTEIDDALSAAKEHVMYQLGRGLTLQQMLDAIAAPQFIKAEINAVVARYANEWLQMNRS